MRLRTGWRRGGSCFAARGFETAPHFEECGAGMAEGGKSDGTKAVVAAGAATAIIGWVGKAGEEKALFFEALEGDVEGTAGDAAAGAFGDFPAHGDGVGAIAETEYGEENHLFEFTQEVLFAHPVHPTRGETHGSQKGQVGKCGKDYIVGKEEWSSEWHMKGAESYIFAPEVEPVEDFSLRRMPCYVDC